jgi:hypothetical protein
LSDANKNRCSIGVNNQYLDFIRQYLAELMHNQVEFLHFANMANQAKWGKLSGADAPGWPYSQPDPLVTLQPCHWQDQQAELRVRVFSVTGGRPSWAAGPARGYRGRVVNSYHSIDIPKIVCRLKFDDHQPVRSKQLEDKVNLNLWG